MKVKYPIIFFLLLPLSFTFCSNDDYVNIGFLAGLSGRRSELGIRARSGVFLAVDTINQSGGINGRKIKLIIRDDKSDPNAIKEIINDFIDKDVHIVIGPLLSKMAHSTLKAIEDKNIIIISPTISSNSISNLDDYFFRLIPSSILQATMLQEKIYKDGYRRTAVVYDLSNQEYTEPIYKLFRKNFIMKGGEVPYVNNMKAKDRLDAISIARSIRISRADSVLLICSGIDAGLLSQQIKKRNMNIQLYGTTWVKTGDVVTHGGKAVEGMIITGEYRPIVVKKKYLSFKNKYIELFKKNPDFVSIYSYESVYLVKRAIEFCNSSDPIRLKKAIININIFNGLHESFSINKNGDASRKKSFYTINKRKFKWISNHED